MKIIVSPGYGAGWSTWGSPEIAYDTEMIEAIEAGDEEAMYARANKLGEYDGGLGDAIIVELPEGTKYRITEYDGHEELETIEDIDWEIAT